MGEVMFPDFSLSNKFRFLSTHLVGSHRQTHPPLTWRRATAYFLAFFKAPMRSEETGGVEKQEGAGRGGEGEEEDGPLEEVEEGSQMGPAT